MKCTSLYNAPYYCVCRSLQFDREVMMILPVDETGNCSVFMTWGTSKGKGTLGHTKLPLLPRSSWGGREGWGRVGWWWPGPSSLSLQAPSLFVSLAWVSKVSKPQSVRGAKLKFVFNRFSVLTLAVQPVLWSPV